MISGYAYATKFDISATISLFDLMHHVRRRTFYLRNLGGETLEERAQGARRILTDFANEIHYITGCGVDKISIRSDRRKIDELVLGLEPHEGLRWFHYAIKFRVHPICTYRWQNKQGATKWRIGEEEIGDGWERVLWIRSDQTKSLTLPCVFWSRNPAEAQEDETPFITYVAPIKRRRKRTGWIAHYDHQDPMLRKFVARFHEDGNLAIGKERYFGLEGRAMQVSGTFVRARKAKRPRIPRKTYLASQPTDETDYVYVIRMGRQNVFKIGKTNDPQGRLTGLQTASPYKLSMTNVFRADNASAAEESLHAALSDSKMEGEWFRMTNVQWKALAAVERFEDGKFIVESRTLTARTLLEG